MRNKLGWLGSVLVFGLLVPGPARACGDGEAPGGCGSDENTARYMLQRVAKALDTDKAKALQLFTRGEAGFRTLDTYVFCVGPDGVMSAHPNPDLQGHDVRELHDRTGNYFISRMLETAKPAEVAQIRYLFPRPGGTEAVPKTTYYTRAGDQVCGVGLYDGNDTQAAAPASRQARLQQLRERLTAGMPAVLGADWTAFLNAMDEAEGAREAALAKARDQLHAAANALDAPGLAPAH